MKKLLSIVVLLSLFSCSQTPLKVAPTDRDPASFQTCFELMVSMMNYKTYEGEAGKAFSKAKSLKGLEALYGGDNLIEIQRRVSNTEILKNNENVKKLLKQTYAPKKMKGKTAIVPIADTKTIYNAMENSNVNKNHDCYDPRGTTGFCFGRATIAHMEAIVREVHPDSIKKIWIAGDMGQWGHHVATMISTERGWMVLDTNLGRVVDTDTWIATYLPQKEGEKDIMVFVTQAGRFGPYDTSPYNAIDLFNTSSEDFKKGQDFFKGYFHDYFKSLDNVINKPLIPKAPAVQAD